MKHQPVGILKTLVDAPSQCSKGLLGMERLTGRYGYILTTKRTHWSSRWLGWRFRQVDEAETAMVVFITSHTLILNRHGIRVYGLLPGYSFETEKNTAIVVLITLHDETALLISIGPGDTDEVLF